MHRFKQLLIAAVLCHAGAAQAQAWPAKPITIVAPFGTGSGTDVISRLYAKYLTEETGATVVVENRPGANAMIGTVYAAKAAPDGYTVLMGSGTANAANYALYADRIAYKPTDFVTVAMTFISPPVIFAAPGVGGAGDDVLKSVAAAKGATRGASCGSGNAVTLVACELLKRLTKTDMVVISYKGNGQSMADLAGGQITLAISDMGAASPLVAAGRARPVAVAAHKRLPGLPNVPTAMEQGVDMDFLSWNALFVPAGTPEAVIQKLNAAAKRMVSSPEGDKARIASAGLEVNTDLTVSRKFVQDEIVKWQRYIRETGVKVE